MPMHACFRMSINSMCNCLKLWGCAFWRNPGVKGKVLCKTLTVPRIMFKSMMRLKWTNKLLSPRAELLLGGDLPVTWNSALDVSKLKFDDAQFTPPGAVARSEACPFWHASGPEFDPHVRHIRSWRLGHEKISTAILPLRLIQEGVYNVHLLIILKRGCSSMYRKKERRAVVSYCRKNVH